MFVTGLHHKWTTKRARDRESRSKTLIKDWELYEHITHYDRDTKKMYFFNIHIIKKLMVLVTYHWRVTNPPIKYYSYKSQHETNLQFFYGSHMSLSLLRTYTTLLQSLNQKLLLCQLLIQEVLLPFPQICSQLKCLLNMNTECNIYKFLTKYSSDINQLT